MRSKVPPRQVEICYGARGALVRCRGALCVVASRMCVLWPHSLGRVACWLLYMYQLRVQLLEQTNEREKRLTSASV